MKKLSEVTRVIEAFADPDLARFDFVGLLQGDMATPIKKIGITLDYSLQAIEQAISQGCDLLITHHGPTSITYPLIGNNLKKLERASSVGLAVYRCHLNLDFCEGGMIDSLCKILEIPATKRELIFGEHLIYGGVNLVENYPMNFDDLMKRVKRLNPRTIRIAGKRREKFARIAITSGQGFFGTFFDQLKPEVYIAGEFEQEAVKYAEDLGVMLVELTHQASECRPLDLIARSLEDKIGLPVVHIEIPDTITNIEIEEK